eukprot:CAMPEP_0198299908 /NCGR_PEP_ID=MMETSP1449-20131203/46202_1 /TAXON_ID=420275 /ORGANISM="Attheya septentrionalis, Strain CCMP2084" /LENGTH=548 /DNA_ID=CAMNT_0044001571 /DNA_START=122 /DNA_END=1768 /DNA_ORIENTATION=-
MKDEEWYTPIEEIEGKVERVRECFRSGRTGSIAWRKGQLKALKKLLQEKEEEICAAIRSDLGHQNDVFCYVGELNTVLSEIDLFLAQLDQWAATRTVSNDFPANIQFPVSSHIRPMPRGTVLIVGAWNFPLNLCLAPLVAALGAGCTALLKPSEVSSAVAEVIGHLLPLYLLDPDAVQVVQGGPLQARTLWTDYRWDAICYTGSTAVGKLVAQAAAVHLTPTLLEMGGKNPVIVDGDVSLKLAAQRIIFGKCFNAGQFCVSPDYILVINNDNDGNQTRTKELIQELKGTLEQFFGPDPQRSPDLSRIVSERHVKRLANLLQGDDTIQILHGGSFDVSAKFVEPTLLTATVKSKCMQEEIFGPILPILSVPSVSDAVRLSHQIKPNPLACYIFSHSSQVQTQIIQTLPAGAVGINDTVKYASNPHLPFGGIGSSGLGNYHGKFGFDFFSHSLAIHHSSFAFGPYHPMDGTLYPPYNSKLQIWLMTKGGQYISTALGLYKHSTWFQWFLAFLPFVVWLLMVHNPALLQTLCDLNITMVIQTIQASRLFAK